MSCTGQCLARAMEIDSRFRLIFGESLFPEVKSRFLKDFIVLLTCFQ